MSPEGPARRLTVHQRRSAIGAKKAHHATLRTLGLRRVGDTRVCADSPEVRGMVASVHHLVTVEEVEDG